MKVKPTSDRLLVRRLESEEKTAGGIIIPETAKEKPAQGIIVAVGSGKVVDGKTIPVSIKAGDKVLFAKWSGTEVKIDGEEMIIIKEDDVLGIIE